MYEMLLPSTGQVSPDLSDAHMDDPPPMSLAPPPPGEFETREELLHYLKIWGKEQGYAVVIGRSRNNRLWIKCDRGGEYADKHLNDPENRKRKRKATRLTGCEFKIKANLKKDNIWRCQTENPHHNHGPSEDLSLHPSIRRMDDEQLQKVNEMTEAGKTPIETLEELKRLWPDLPVLKRDIYNARKKYKTEKEAREAAEAMDPGQQDFEDPNVRMPGPTRTGRWEWLEEGDEVKRKKKRAKSATAALESTPTIDGHDEGSPTMSTMGPPPPSSSSSQQQQQQLSHSMRSNAANMGALQNAYHAGALSPRSAAAVRMSETDFASSLSYSAAPPARFRHFTTPNPAPPMPHHTYNTPAMNANTDPMLQSTMTPRTRPPDNMANITPVMATRMMHTTPVTQSTSLSSYPAAKPAPVSGAVLMSRIEKMEQEQIEQQKMLSQILSAVQGVAVQGVGGTPRRG